MSPRPSQFSTVANCYAQNGCYGLTEATSIFLGFQSVAAQKTACAGLTQHWRGLNLRNFLPLKGDTSAKVAHRGATLPHRWRLS